mgnify:CR=1 FL=1
MMAATTTRAGVSSITVHVTATTTVKTMHHSEMLAVLDGDVALQAAIVHEAVRISLSERFGGFNGFEVSGATCGAQSKEVHAVFDMDGLGRCISSMIASYDRTMGFLNQLDEKVAALQADVAVHPCAAPVDPAARRVVTDDAPGAALAPAAANPAAVAWDRLCHHVSALRGIMNDLHERLAHGGGGDDVGKPVGKPAPEAAHRSTVVTGEESPPRLVAAADASPSSWRERMAKTDAGEGADDDGSSDEERGLDPAVDAPGDGEDMAAYRLRMGYQPLLGGAGDDDDDDDNEGDDDEEDHTRDTNDVAGATRSEVQRASGDAADSHGDDPAS